MALADNGLQQAKKQFSKNYKQELEKKQLIFKLKRFSNWDIDFGNSANKKWTLDDLSMLAKTATLKPYNITVYDAKFMGVYLKSFNDGQEKHIDLLYNSNAEHVDVITSMKGLFSVRFYCYACHKGFSTVKHLCAASSYAKVSYAKVQKQGFYCVQY